MRDATVAQHCGSAGRRVALAAIIICGVTLCLWVLRRHDEGTPRPALLAGERYAVDVSHHQGQIDWQQVAHDAIAVAYLKATEGATYTDQNYALNSREALDAGLLVGAYHYFTLCSAGAAQAQNVIRTVPRRATMLPVALDVEFIGNCATRPAEQSIDAELGEFLSRVESHYAQPVTLYLGPEVLLRYPRIVLLARPPRVRWMRAEARPAADVRWGIWQATDNAHVSGIAGAVDLNVVRASHGDVNNPIDIHRAFN
jgi:lysozyme